MYDYLELMDIYSWDVERVSREIETMRRKQNDMAEIQSESAGTHGGGLHGARALRGDRKGLE